MAAGSILALVRADQRRGASGNTAVSLRVVVAGGGIHRLTPSKATQEEVSPS